MTDQAPKTGGGVAEKSRPEVQRPQLFKVILHNDDYTTMEFVVEVLETIFDKSAEEAVRIMLQVHLEGYGLCGTYSHEVAETKVAQVYDGARTAGFPLRASLEEA